MQNLANKSLLTEWSYDRIGRQKTITGYVDEANPQVCQTTVYDYDKLNQVNRITYPDVHSECKEMIIARNHLDMQRNI